MNIVEILELGLEVIVFLMLILSGMLYSHLADMVSSRYLDDKMYSKAVQFVTFVLPTMVSVEIASSSLKPNYRSMGLVAVMAVVLIIVKEKE